MENQELNLEQNVVDEVDKTEVDLGTFKSVKNLKEAYDSLRKTFTQNAMELAKMKKEKAEDNATDNQETTQKTQKNDEKKQNLTENQDNLDLTTQSAETSQNDIMDESDKVNHTPDNNKIADKEQSPATNIFESEEWQQEVKQFFVQHEDAREFAKDIGRIIMQDKAVQNSADPLGRAWIKILADKQKQSFSTEEELMQVALNNEAIKQRIVEDYLSSLHKNSSPRLIAKPVGAEFNAKNTSRPLNMAQARAMAEKILIK